jgi:hypothetical protein
MLMVEVSGDLITMDHMPSQGNKEKNVEKIKGFKPLSKITRLLMREGRR